MNQHRLELSSFSLHLLAMGLMLCDHMWASVLPAYDVLTWVGRIAYPIFAFLLAEGFAHTRNVKKYMLRMLLAAIISEIPFNLLYSGTVIWPFHQNVLWTFLIALLCMRGIQKLCSTVHPGTFSLAGISIDPIRILGILAIMLAGYLGGYLFFVDYYGPGVLLAILFYLFRGRRPWQLLGQFAGMYWVNCILLAGLFVPIPLGSFTLEFPQQATAMLALIPIWLYHGSQGPHRKWTRWLFYGFYPLHCLVLGLASM